MREPAPQLPAPLTRVLFCCCLGAAAGLAAFAAETAAIVQSSRGVLAFDASGTARAAVAAASPALRLLLLRIAVAYAVVGSLTALGSAALAADVARTRRGFRLLWAADAAAFCAIAWWATCIERPALFDDLDALRPLVVWIARHGAPWQPIAAAALLFAAHLGRSHRRARTLARGAVALSLSLLPRASLPSAKAPHAPLVVMIGLDAFRPDRVEGAYLARHLAPNLESFLRGAVRFDRAYTPIAQTEPAWAALLTASWPWRTGVRHPLTPEAQRAPLPTFAAAYASAGFHTTFATDCSRFNWLGPDSGFATRLQPPRGALNFVLEKLRYRTLGVFAANALGSLWLPEIVDNRALPGLHDALGYSHRLADRLASEAAAGPALFAVHHVTIHYPGDVAYPFSQRSPDAPLRMTYELPGNDRPAEADRAQREQLYDELVSEADAQLGILLDRLRAEGRFDDAWIVVFSDHGDGFQPAFPQLARSVPVHGARLSDDENRILLAFKPPLGSGIAGGRTLHDLVRLIDLAPTLLEASGLPPLSGPDGTSLLPLLRGEPLPPLVLYAETGFTHVAPDAFDPGHFSGGARGFDAWRVADDGAVEMSDAAHFLALREKDVGAFDGDGWLIRAPRAGGGVLETCAGRCSPQLRGWLASMVRQGALASAF
ncbi:MAG TPA: sulfatase-like hydrolase/transferase [Myxococcales bacterium]|nr:sulfatase-like hydrolase/transferase [Myxococcales bacterium]